MNSLAFALFWVAACCGLIQGGLTLWHESGTFIAVWLGILTTLVVACGLGLFYLVLRMFNAEGLLTVVSLSLAHSCIAWSLFGVAVLFIAGAIFNPARAFDIGFFVPMGLAYGLPSGFVYWVATRYPFASAFSG